MKVILVLIAVLLAFAVTGCGEQPAPETTDNTATEEPVATETAPNNVASGQPGDTIVLPAGWVMTDAITPAEVEAIMGMTGFAAFPEAASNAPGGRPVGGYNIGSVPYSKVRFEVDIAGGRDGYDLALGYLTNPVEVSGDLWDVASIGDVPQADRMPIRFVGLRGDLCFIIDWEPAVFPTLDRTETSVKLAELLINKLYTQQ